MAERNLLASVLASREAFDTIHQHVREGDLSEQGNIILTHAAAYYERDADATQIDADLLARDVGRSLSNPKHREMFDKLITTLGGTDCSPANVIHDFIEVKREAAGAKLASALAAAASADKVRPLLDEYTKWESCTTLEDYDDVSEIYIGENVANIVGTTYTDGLIEIWPKTLNDRLDGGLLRGHHMLIFARPEMGKTMMLVNMIAGFLHQKLNVLYVGNEDPISDIVMRVVSRLTGLTKYEILEDPDLADQAARTKGYDNLVLAGLAPGTPGQIQKLIDEYSPDVVLIDQLRNLNVNEEHFVQKLEKAATSARNLGKSNNVLVVSVTQAGDSASGKGPLDMGDVDSSNTGIPAQVDVMVGIGATVDDEASNRRILSLPKNKRSGNHEFFPVGIDPQLSRVRSLA